MHMIKKENGITMTMLVITIIVLGMISTIVIRYSINGIEYTNNKKDLIELENVQHAVSEYYELYKNTGDDSYLIQKSEVDSGTINLMRNKVKAKGNLKYDKEITEETPSSEKYYFIAPEDLKEMGIEEATSTYIVNYYTGECYNYTKQYTSDKKTLLYVD